VTGISVPRPDDFDEFWAQTLADLPEAAPELTHVPALSTDTVDVFDLRYSSYQGVRVAAWYAVPRGADAPLPGLVQIPG
jgi:cephalosporin-C deacetylase